MGLTFILFLINYFYLIFVAFEYFEGYAKLHPILAGTGIGEYVNVTRFFVDHTVLFANDGANIQKRIDIEVLLVRFLAFKAVIHAVLSSYKAAVQVVQGFCTASTKALYWQYKALVLQPLRFFFRPVKPQFVSIVTEHASDILLFFGCNAPQAIAA